MDVDFPMLNCSNLPPFLVVIEGVDGVGKTTVSKRLAERLGAFYYKSPGGPFAEMRRHVDQSIDPLCRYFFYRSAVQYDSVAIKTLMTEQSVVCDRYIDSTEVCHQALDATIARVFNRAGLVLPNFVFILTATEDMRRLRNKGRQDLNCFDQNREFQRMSDELFKQLGHPVIDTTEMNADEVVEDIFRRLQEKRDAI